MNRTRDWGFQNWAVAAIIILIAACLAFSIGWLVYAEFFERHEYRAEIVERWWDTSTRVTYTTSRTVVSSELVCSGSGEDRVCRTELSTHTVTDTHTRCRKTLTGRDWPARYPAADCKIAGDSVGHSISYRVRYRPQETAEKKVASFNGMQWSQLEPGTWATLVVNGLGRVVEIGERG